jgi:acid stress-induced BolA-like protein IbaG/YrbA
VFFIEGEFLLAVESIIIPGSERSSLFVRRVNRFVFRWMVCRQGGAPRAAPGDEGRWFMDSKTIEQMIRDGLPGAEVTVSGDDGVHFEAVVRSASFAGKPTLARHRMVYATLGELMGNEIHALSLSTELPE